MTRKDKYNETNKHVSLCVCLTAYLFGAYSYPRDIWPISTIRAIKHKVAGTAPALTEFDSFGRFISVDKKIEFDCPKQTDKTVVALVFGQSNSANHDGQRTVQKSVKIVNYFAGKCYVASDPLLGATGNAGSVWTLLGTKLLATGKYDNIVFIPAGIGGTQIKRWAQGGDLNKMLDTTIKSAAGRYNITHIIWHQGESDAALNTTTSQYKELFNSMVRTIRTNKVNAPIFISTASICGNYKNSLNDVTKAQRELVSIENGILAGPDTDKLNSDEDRYDDCHFSYAGVQKFSDLLLQTVFK